MLLHKVCISSNNYCVCELEVMLFRFNFTLHDTLLDLSRELATLVGPHSNVQLDTFIPKLGPNQRQT